MGGDSYVVVVSKEAHKKLDDLVNKSGDLKIPEQGPGSTSNMANRITWSTLAKVVNTSTTQIVQRLHHGRASCDGDVTMLASGSAKRYNKGGDCNILAHFADEVDPTFLGRLTAKTLGTQNCIARPIENNAGPAGMSKEVMDEWNNALSYAVNHPDIQARLPSRTLPGL